MLDIYYANALVLTTQHEEAIPILHAAISNNPEEPYLHFLLSRAYGETGQAYESLRERGEHHYLNGNYEFAIKQYKRAFLLTNSEYERERLGARIEDVEKELKEIKSL